MRRERERLRETLTPVSVILMCEVVMLMLASTHRELFEQSFSTAAFRISIPE